MSEQRMYPVKLLASLWGLSEKTIRRKIWAGELKAKRMGGKVLVPAAEVERYERSLPAA